MVQIYDYEYDPNSERFVKIVSIAQLNELLKINYDNEDESIKTEYDILITAELIRVYTRSYHKWIKKNLKMKFDDWKKMSYILK